MGQRAFYQELRPSGMDEDDTVREKWQNRMNTLGTTWQVGAVGRLFVSAGNSLSRILHLRTKQKPLHRGYPGTLPIFILTQS